MSYRCITCARESPYPMCRVCASTSASDVATKRKSDLTATMGRVGVPEVYRNCALTPDQEDLLKGKDNQCSVIYGETIPRNTLAAALMSRRLRRMAETTRTEVVDWWRGSVWMRSTELIRTIKESFDNSGTSVSLALLCKLPFLVVTDLGEEGVTPWSSQQWEDLLESRVGHNRRTIITTGLKASDLSNLYGDWGASIERTLRGCDLIKVSA